MTALKLPPPLVAISPGDVAERGIGAFAIECARCAVRGLRALVVREPKLSDRATLELALRLRDTLPRDTWLSIHDRVHLVIAARADAVHVGFRSLPPDEARAILPSDVALGFSAHAEDDAGAWRACDWLLFGPVFATPSKRGWKEPAGLAGLTRATQRSPKPMWALGGILPEHVESALHAGARGVASLSGIFGAPDPAAACARYLDALRAAEKAGAP